MQSATTSPQIAAKGSIHFYIDEEGGFNASFCPQRFHIEAAHLNYFSRYLQPTIQVSSVKSACSYNSAQLFVFTRLLQRTGSHNCALGWQFRL